MAAALFVRRPNGSPRLTTLQALGWSATFCCLTGVAGGWVGELVPFHFAPAPKPVAPLESPVAWAAWVAPRWKPSLANPMAGGRVRYPR